MSYSNAYSVGRSSRYSGKKISVPVNFLCVAKQAKHVSLIGDFNGWDSGAHPLKRGHDGSWSIQIPLCHGHHNYLFWVDGVATLDPRAQGISRNEQFGRVSLLAVS